MLISFFSLFSVCSDSVLSKNSDVVQTTLVSLEEFCVTNIPPGLDLYEVSCTAFVSPISMRCVLSRVVIILLLLQLYYCPSAPLGRDKRKKEDSFGESSEHFERHAKVNLSIGLGCRSTGISTAKRSLNAT